MYRLFIMLSPRYGPNNYCDELVVDNFYLTARNLKLIRPILALVCVSS